MLICMASAEESYQIEREKKEVVSQELLQVAKNMFKSNDLLIEDIFVLESFLLRICLQLAD